MTAIYDYFLQCKQALAVRKILSCAMALGLFATPQPAAAQLIGSVERAAAGAAARNAIRASERRAARSAAGAAERRAVRRPVVRQEVRRPPCTAIAQKCASLLREEAAGRILASRYPNERIQPETYLVNRDGTVAIDPKTGKGRRIDFVMFSDGRISRRYEITSQFEDKQAQLAKESRIMKRYANGRLRAGPVYVYDRTARRLVPVPPGVSEIMRFN